MKDSLIKELEAIEEFFNRSTDCLTEENSSFVPVEGTFTVAHQVAHVAQTIEWFLDGMTSQDGFNMDFEKHWEDIKDCKSLTSARDRFRDSIVRAKEVVNQMSEEELKSSLPEGPVMGGQPKFSVIGAISDHTAHHRGALSVYSRLLGYVPKMPYI